MAPLAIGAPLLPSFGIGCLLQRHVLNRTVGRNPLPSMVVTFGMSIVIQNLLLRVFSADPRALDAGPLATSSLALGGDLAVGWLPLLIFGLALLGTARQQALFDHTALGRSFRAVSDDR